MSIRILECKSGEAVIYDSVYEKPLGLIFHPMGELDADEVAYKFLASDCNMRYMSPDEIVEAQEKFLCELSKEG